MPPYIVLLLLGALFVLTPGLASSADDLLRQSDLGASLRAPTGGVAGAAVGSVAEDSAAQVAGLQEGDRVLEIDGVLLADPTTFQTALRAVREGDRPVFTVVRGERVFETTLEAPPRVREEVEGIDITYGSVLTARGYRTRILTSRPTGIEGPLPALFLVSWMSCNPVERLGNRDGISQFLEALSRQSGWVVMRPEKPGVGDSEGPPCREVDFASELAAYRAAFEALRTMDGVDPERIVVLGLSNGGGVAPLVHGDHPVAGYVISGGWVKSWFEHMIEHERRRLALSGDSPAQVNAKMAGTAELYTDYLIRGLTPGEAVAAKPHLAPLWTDEPGHQYGRPAVFFHQLQDLNLVEAWGRVEAPVLAIYGEHDWIMSKDDHRIIVDLVNARNPGTARFVEIPGMEHSFFRHNDPQSAFDDYWSGEFAEDTVPLVLDWLRETAGPVSGH